MRNYYSTGPLRRLAHFFWPKTFSVSEDLAEMVEEGDLDDKLDDKAAIKVVDHVLVSTLATNTCTAL